MGQIAGRDIPASLSDGQTLVAGASGSAWAGAAPAGSGDMTKAVYDSNEDGKVSSADSADAVAWAGVSGKPATFPPDAHEHAATAITSGTLDGDRLPALSTTKRGGAPATGTPTGKFLRDDATWQTVTGGDGPLFVGATSGNVATAADTVPVDVTGLVFSYVASSVYQIILAGATQAAATTTGNRFAFNVSGAVTRVGIMGVQQLANTGTVTGHQSIADDASVGLTSARPSTNTDTAYMGIGYLVTAAGQSGTCQLRFISETTAVATCMAGFTMTVFKVV